MPDNSKMSNRQATALLVVICLFVAFPLTVVLSAIWLGVYEWIRSHGFGFWQAAVIYAAFVTLVSGITAAARIDRYKQ